MELISIPFFIFVSSFLFYYSISVVERNSHSYNYRIILKESNNIFNPFTITQICCDAGPHCSVIGVLIARLNAKHLGINIAVMSAFWDHVNII